MMAKGFFCPLLQEESKAIFRVKSPESLIFVSHINLVF